MLVKRKEEKLRDDIGKDILTIDHSLSNVFPIVISIPHSGIKIPNDMREKMLPDTVLTNSDWYLCELYGFLADLGFTVVTNNISRYVIDVNRDIRDNEGLSYKTNVIYKQTTQGYPIYQVPLTQDEIINRIRMFYLPYHDAIKKELGYKKKYFDTVYLIDLHSFGLDEGGDVVLGNVNGNSCARYLFDFFKTQFQKKEYSVKENIPYAGGYITRNYGNGYDIQALQIELWYRKYIDKREFGNEELPPINPQLFKNTQADLLDIFRRFGDWALNL